MSYPSASIQSFFEKEAPVQSETNASTTYAIEPGDGFTGEEIDAALHPTLHKWQARVEYHEIDIKDLVPGPGCVQVTGRVVNFHDQINVSKMPQAAKGSIKIIVKDDTGAMVVKLWYARVVYNLRLGQLVSVWTPHISSTDSTSLTLQRAGLLTNIFPERDNSCYFVIHKDSDCGTLCMTPLGYEEGKQLAGLMTLKNFVEGGHEVVDGKILVCVKSIGGRKKFTSKKGNPLEKLDVCVFDDTFEATLTLWGSMTSSAASWKPSHTTLLMLNPNFTDKWKPMLSIGPITHVDVDPVMRDAEWLRGFAQKMTTREHVNPEFPDDVFDVETATTSELRILFTLADIDEFVRAKPSEKYMGYLSVVIIELNIMKLYHRNMLCCTEWHVSSLYLATSAHFSSCGVPLFANATSAKCKQCENETPLRINPRLVGTMIDEAGSIACGKLVWSTAAWERLLGRTPEELVKSSAQLLRYLEYRLVYLRVTLLFGWSEELGKLAVCQVMQ